MNKEDVFDTLWQQYTQTGSQAGRIYQCFLDKGETVVNDCIGLRTCNDPRVTIDKLAQLFTQLGYEETHQYAFAEDCLFAKQYAHKEDPDAPKLFISELLLEKFSADLRSILCGCIDQIPVKTLSSEQLVFSGVSWLPLSLSTYESLLTESAYAAWLYAFGFCANYFSVNINALSHFNEMSEVNSLIEAAGFSLNKEGKPIKESPADYLAQSRTLTEHVAVKFLEGEKEVPFAYYVFTKH